MFRVRLVRTVIALAPDNSQSLTEPLRRTVLDDTIGASDAFAAREILRRPILTPNDQHHGTLEALIHNSGLDRGTIPAPDLATMNDALNIAGKSLAHCLTRQNR
ncbi:hypothetical protein ACFQ61_09485 [Streptomyces sp. NPDC056500]|uniref:hypothetical protein n=1 Tax=Streptomyces sp. NPDC056500 TaxID=3345840 RepID=UPI0036C1CB53